jgi:hypothetical protein
VRTPDGDKGFVRAIRFLHLTKLAADLENGIRVRPFSSEPSSDPGLSCGRTWHGAKD